MWNKIKNQLRSIEARTDDELHAAIVTAFTEVTAGCSLHAAMQ